MQRCPTATRAHAQDTSQQDLSQVSEEAHEHQEISQQLHQLLFSRLGGSGLAQEETPPQGFHLFNITYDHCWKVRGVQGVGPSHQVL